MFEDLGHYGCGGKQRAHWAAAGRAAAARSTATITRTRAIAPRETKRGVYSVPRDGCRWGASFDNAKGKARLTNCQQRA